MQDHGQDGPGTTGQDPACIGTISQPRLHGAIALIPTPSFELAQTRTVGAHGCWDCLAGVSASSNEGFALGGPRNGRVRQKNGQGENMDHMHLLLSWDYVGSKRRSVLS